jgi:hypothetical protein
MFSSHEIHIEGIVVGETSPLQYHPPDKQINIIFNIYHL